MAQGQTGVRWGEGFDVWDKGNPNARERTEGAIMRAWRLVVGRKG